MSFVHRHRAALRPSFAKVRALCFAASLLMVTSAAWGSPTKRSQSSSGSPTKRSQLPPEPQRSLPVFEFMGQNTESVSSMQNLNGNACTTDGDKTTCSDYSTATLAGRSMRYISIGFYKGRLSTVLVSFGEYAREPVLAALTAKYGKPDEVAAQKWQSKAGATFDNQVTRWHFKGGLLEYDEMGSTVDTGLVMFLSTENRPPKQQPKIDF